MVVEYRAMPGGGDPLEVVSRLNHLGAKGWQLVCFHDGVGILTRPKPVRPKSTATSLTVTFQGGRHMATTFTVDDTAATATVQFTDDHGDAVPGPNDSVTGAPVVPVVTSDNASALTVGAATDNGNGSFTFPLTPVAVGAANVGVTLANSDGSPVVDADGNPLAIPAASAVTVTAGPVAGLVLTTSA